MHSLWWSSSAFLCATTTSLTIIIIYNRSPFDYNSRQRQQQYSVPRLRKNLYLQPGLRTVLYTTPIIHVLQRTYSCTSLFRVPCCLILPGVYTLCLKKVPTFKLSVTLSNLNRFSKFLRCWKAYEIYFCTSAESEIGPNVWTNMHCRWNTVSTGVSVRLRHDQYVFGVPGLIWTQRGFYFFSCPSPTLLGRHSSLVIVITLRSGFDDPNSGHRRAHRLFHTSMCD